MKQRILAARSCITALFVILFSLCLALGAWFALPNAAYADGEEGGEDGINEWIVKPFLTSWTVDEFDSEVNLVSAEPRYGRAEMYFRIYGYQDSPLSETPLLMPYSFENGETDEYIFRLEEDGGLPDYVCTVLNKLEVGTYYLLGIVPETELETEEGTLHCTGINNSGAVIVNEETTTTFRVLKKTVYNSLSITEWEWGKFDYRTNIISSDITVDESLTVTYAVADYNNTQISSLNSFTVNEYGMVNELSARVALNNLDAGDYWLMPSTGEHSTTDEPYKVAFTVAPYSNAWLAAPSINEWTWGEYNLNVNAINGYAIKNDRGVVYFGIYTAENEAYSSALEKFTVSDGGIVNESIGAELKNLPAGEYTLRCWIENDNKNYVDISETVKFSVKHVLNSWSVSPYVLSWKYGDYDRELNIIKSEAVLGSKTQYAIYADAECKEAVIINGSEWFELDKDGLVPESVEAVLKTINAGTYHLKCLVTNDNPNYADLSETIPFAVLQIPNSWVVAPSIISWNEGHFDINENPLSGTAKAGSVKFTVYDEKDNILYIINTSEDGVITSVTNPDGESLHISVLNKLSVGSYKLVAEVESSDNYTTLTTIAYFAVFEDSVALSGIIAAAVTFAIVDVIAAALCITLLILRRRKVEKQFRNMVRKELGRK